MVEGAEADAAGQAREGACGDDAGLRSLLGRMGWPGADTEVGGGVGRRAPSGGGRAGLAAPAVPEVAEEEGRRRGWPWSWDPRRRSPPVVPAWR